MNPNYFQNQAPGGSPMNFPQQQSQQQHQLPQQLQQQQQHFTYFVQQPQPQVPPGSPLPEYFQHPTGPGHFLRVDSALGPQYVQYGPGQPSLMPHHPQLVQQGNEQQMLQAAQHQQYMQALAAQQQMFQAQSQALTVRPYEMAPWIPPQVLYAFGVLPEIPRLTLSRPPPPPLPSPFVRDALGAPVDVLQGIQEALEATARRKRQRTATDPFLPKDRCPGRAPVGLQTGNELQGLHEEAEELRVAEIKRSLGVGTRRSGKRPKDLTAAEFESISGPTPSHARQCTHCGVRKTVQWRQGPDGVTSLCNRCGMNFRLGRLDPQQCFPKLAPLKPQADDDDFLFHESIFEEEEESGTVLPVLPLVVGKTQPSVAAAISVPIHVEEEADADNDDADDAVACHKEEAAAPAMPATDPAAPDAPSTADRGLRQGAPAERPSSPALGLAPAVAPVEGPSAAKVPEARGSGPVHDGATSGSPRAVATATLDSVE